MNKTTFDHLKLIATGNEDIKDAYWAGFNDGRAKGDEVARVDRFDSTNDFLLSIENRLDEVRKITNRSFNKKDYSHGIKDAQKIFLRYFKIELK